jgi:hypothetical protein
VDLLELFWLSGQVDTIKDLKPNQVYVVKEGQGEISSTTPTAAKPSK